MTTRENKQKLPIWASAVIFPVYSRRRDARRVG